VLGAILLSNDPASQAITSTKAMTPAATGTVTFVIRHTALAALRNPFIGSLQSRQSAS
jgi:hypothetical protein